MIRFVYPKAYGSLLRIGTSSWKYKSWKGLIYDPEKSYRPEDYLADYARSLNSVEVDQWFYSLFPAGVKLPEGATVRAYARSVPKYFKFSVKAPNALTLTHYQAHGTGAKQGPLGAPNPNFLSRDLLRRFLDRLSPLGPKLGPVMFQFEYLNRRKMPSAAEFWERFGGFIDRAPGGFQYALETRNPSYLTPEFFGRLSALGLGYVGIEGYYMPHLPTVFSRLKPALEGFCVLRLHGGSREDMGRRASAKWDSITTPQGRLLRGVARIVRSNIRRKILTYVNFSNHLEGSAPRTIVRFLEALKAEKG